MLREAGALDLTRAIAFVLALAALWMILTPYPGITHDGQGYALQAVSLLTADVFTDDIFLRFQSQNDFTVFPILQAVAIRTLGLDWGTAVLTLVFQAAWFLSAWLVLKRLLTPDLAMLSLGLLVVVPGYYGAMRIFQFAEPFLTARLPAEALCLLAVALYLGGRRLLGGAVLLLALVLHPLMSFPAALLVGALAIWDKWDIRTSMLGIALTGAAAILVSALPFALQPRLDLAWLEMLRGRSPHLFLDLWEPLDWNSTVQVLATLAIVAVCSQARMIRRIAVCALAVGITGLILAAAVSHWPQLDLLLKGQPWRWLWLGKFLAIAFLPEAVKALWGGESLRRAAALLLISSWLLILPISAKTAVTQSLPAILAVVALGLQAARGSQISVRLQILSLRGSWLILAFVAAAAVLTTALITTMKFADTPDPHWLRMLGNVLNLTAPAVAIVVAAWRLTVRGGPSSVLAVLAVAVVAIAAVSPWRVPTWTAKRWSGASHEEFADWRAKIPTRSEVLWWDGLREVWFLLERRSYLTDSQAGGIVFSPDLVAEIQRRAKNIEPYVPATQHIAGTAQHALDATLTAASLGMICQDPQLGFVVAEDDLGIGAPSHLWPSRETRVFLYDCGRVRTTPPNTP